MNNIYEIIKKYRIHPVSYLKIGKVTIIKDKNKSYVIKLNTNNYDIYKYLESRGFFLFPACINNYSDSYDILEYIPDILTNKEQKINDLIKTLSLLHNKTIYLRDANLDEIKAKYEQLDNDINKTRKYYLELNDLIDQELFFSPSKYLLIRNISTIYFLLDYAKNNLDKWYKKIINEKSIRISLLHNNVDISHLINNENKYLISWDYSYFESPIYDFISFYKKYFSYLSLNNALMLYEEENKLLPLEKEFLLINLSIPKLIELTSDTYSDTIKINNEIKYLNKIFEYIKFRIE